MAGVYLSTRPCCCVGDHYCTTSWLGCGERKRESDVTSNEFQCGTNQAPSGESEEAGGTASGRGKGEGASCGGCGERRDGTCILL